MDFMSEQTLERIIIMEDDASCGRMISYAYQGGEPYACRGTGFFQQRAVEYQRTIIIRRGSESHNALQTTGYALNEVWCAGSFVSFIFGGGGGDR